MLPEKRFPRAVAVAAAMALSLPLTLSAAGTAFAADTTIDFTTTKPVGVDVAGATKDTFSIPAVKGVTNYIVEFTGGLNAGRTVIYTPSATAKVPTQGATKVDLQPVAAVGYAIGAGDTTISLLFDAATTPITVGTAPTKTDLVGRSKDRIVITPVANVSWLIGDATTPVAVVGTAPRSFPVPASAYGAANAGASVLVKAVPATADYSVTSTTTLTFADKDEIDLVVGDVIAEDASGVSQDLVVLKYVAGLKWSVNGKAVSVPAPTTKNPNPIVKVLAGKVTSVKADLAQPTDYQFKAGAKTEWTRADLTTLKTDKATPTLVAPVATNAPLIAKDTIKLTGTAGVVWQVESGPAEKRTTKKYPVADGKTQVVPAGENPGVSAAPANADDVAITGTTSWNATVLTIDSKKKELAAPTVPAKKDDNPGTAKDTVTLTGSNGVKFVVGPTASDKAAKTYAVANGKTMTVPVPAGSTVFAVPVNGKEFEFKSGDTVSWDRSALTLAATKTEITSLVAPVGVDLPGEADKITLTGVAGVQWKVDGTKLVKVAATKTVTVAGRSVEAVPLDADAWNITATTTSWNATALSLTQGDAKVKVDGVNVPVGTNAAGVTKDCVKLTGVANVSYTVGVKKYAVAAGKALTAPMLPTDKVTAVAAKGYAIDGTSEWTGAGLGLAADTTKVVVTAPTKSEQPGLTKDAVMITPAANIVWEVNGVKVSPTGAAPVSISTKGAASVLVKASGKTADVEVDGSTKEWTLTFVNVKEDLAPTIPTLENDAHAVKLTKLNGVVWKIDGKVVATANAVTYVVIPATKATVVVTATAANDKDYTITQNASTELTFS